MLLKVTDLKLTVCEVSMTAAKQHDKVIGYVRVSTLDQNTERQLEGIKSARWQRRERA
jgi:hypothetical protein